MNNMQHISSEEFLNKLRLRFLGVIDSLGLTSTLPSANSTCCRGACDLNRGNTAPKIDLPYSLTLIAFS